jgi:hypothetical protein
MAKKIKKVSERKILSATGQEVESWVEARQVAYTAIDEKFTVELNLAELPETSRFGLMAFGALTLLGNQTNSVRNPGEGESPFANQQEALEAAVEALQSGQWPGGGESQGSLRKLAEAVGRVKAAEGNSQSSDYWLDRIREKAVKDEAYIRGLRKNPQVAAALAAITAERAAARAESAGNGGGEALDI